MRGLSATRRRWIAVSSFFFFVFAPVVAYASVTGLDDNDRDFIDSSSLSFAGQNQNNTSTAPHRKLLLRETAMEEPTRIWGEKCTKSDIVINQGPTSPLPTGIPTYTVEIMNVCVTGCDISRIHLSCGWFSSARLVNPRVFKRLRYNDCLVNDGKPLVNGGTLSFQYANTFLYPLSVSSVVCA